MTDAKTFGMVGKMSDILDPANPIQEYLQVPQPHLNPESSNYMDDLVDTGDSVDWESWMNELQNAAIVNGFEVYQCNADALDKIFQNHAHFADQFQLKDREFQSNIMNALAEVYQKLDSDLNKLELTDIDGILVRVKDMEVIGLEVSWLRETLENQAKIKKMEEGVRESNLELARLKNKQRLE